MASPFDKSTPTVWIIEQNRLAAEYLLQVLNKDNGFEAYWLQHSAFHKKELGLDTVFVLDKVGLSVSVVEYVKRLAHQFKDARYIVLDSSLDKYSLFHLLSAGIHGFVTHQEVVTALRPAILSVWEGRMWIDSRLFQEYTSYSTRTRKSQASLMGEESTTVRENEILHLVRQRLSNKEIASILNIGVSTVKFHLSNLFSKLQVTARSDLWLNSCIDLDVIASGDASISQRARAPR